MEYKFTDANFEEEVLKSDKPVLVDFYADWCGPCKMMGPVVSQIAEAYDGQIKVGKINVDENRQSAGAYNVMSIPFFGFFKDGKLVTSALGAIGKDGLEAKLKEIL